MVLGTLSSCMILSSFLFAILPSSPPLKKTDNSKDTNNNNNNDTKCSCSSSSSRHCFFPKDEEKLQKQFQFVPDLFDYLPSPFENEDDDYFPSSLIIADNDDDDKNVGGGQRRTYAMVVSYYGPIFRGGYEFINNNDDERLTIRGTLTQAIEDTLETIMRGEGGRAESSSAPTPGGHHHHHHKIQLQTAGRTDACVSAKANVFSFVSRRKQPGGGRMLLQRDLQQFQFNLNQRLHPHKMKIIKLVRVQDHFHATFSTISRQYLYVLPLPRSIPPAKGQKYATALHNTLQNVCVKNKGAEIDYKAISSGKIKTRDSLCTIQDATVRYWNIEIGHPNQSHEQQQQKEEEKEPVAGFTQAWKKATSPQQQLIRDTPQQNSSSSSSSSTVESESSSESSSLSCCYKNDYPHCLVFSIRANRFLKRMMRKLINGLLLDHVDENEIDNNQQQQQHQHQEGRQPAAAAVHGGVLQDDDDDDGENRFRNRLNSMDRSFNHPAPAEGLCLWRVWHK